jgi:hypothetical protein
MRRPDQLARQIRPIDGLREEEPQRRDDAVHRRRRYAGLALFNLELTHIMSPSPGASPWFCTACADIRRNRVQPAERQ